MARVDFPAGKFPVARSLFFREAGEEMGSRGSPVVALVGFEGCMVLVGTLVLVGIVVPEDAVVLLPVYAVLIASAFGRS